MLLGEAESDRAPAEGVQVHHTPEGTGDTVGTARAGRSIVTHVGPFLTPQQAVARASARFDGPVLNASAASFMAGVKAGESGAV
ncbi:hypothetical protein ACWCXX_18400 [Streptomyces sp. NPDC001732]